MAKIISFFDRSELAIHPVISLTHGDARRLKAELSNLNRAIQSGQANATDMVRARSIASTLAAWQEQQDNVTQLHRPDTDNGIA